MNDDPHRFRSTIRLSDSVIRLAESVAAKHGVTVSEFIELLLLQFMEHTASTIPARAHSQPRVPARVINLDERRHP